VVGAAGGDEREAGLAAGIAAELAAGVGAAATFAGADAALGGCPAGPDETEPRDTCAAAPPDATGAAADAPGLASG
jgi:hypothetical protein